MPMLSPVTRASAAVLHFSPSNIAKRRLATWRGLQVETLEVTHREPFDYQFQGNHHLLIAAEAASREDGETSVDGLPRSRLREFSGKLSFIPAGHGFRGWQKPSILARSVYIYIDPNSSVVPPEIRFGAAAFKPRLFFTDSSLWEMALKLKREAETPSTALYAEALEVVLAHELLRLNETPSLAEGVAKGGLAAWQKKRVASYIDEHFAEDVPLLTLAQIAGLSPYHFSRAFKESFGIPPHRYQMITRIERAKLLLAEPQISVTQAGIKVGFSETSSFSIAFRKITRQSPSEYRRCLE
jgi:AraC family transcriptional regulator